MGRNRQNRRLKKEEQKAPWLRKGLQKITNVFTKTLTKNDGLMKGTKAFEVLQGYKYKLKFQNHGKLSVIDTTVRGSKNWIFRLDKPHKGIDTNHININPKFSGKADPHIPLPKGFLTVGSKAAKTLQYLNKANKYILLPLSIAIDTTNVVRAAYNDYKQGTTRQTVGTVAQVSGAWGGGFGGSMTGAFVGNLAFPAVGGIIGGVAGALGGGYFGSFGMDKVVDVIGDYCGYDLTTASCIECNKKFKLRKYLGEKSDNYICFDCVECLVRRTCDVCGMLNDDDISDPINTDNLCVACISRIDIFYVEFP